MIVVMGKLTKAHRNRMMHLSPGSVLAVVGREAQQRRHAPDWLVCYAGPTYPFLYIEETDITVYAVENDDPKIELLFAR